MWHKIPVSSEQDVETYLRNHQIQPATVAVEKKEEGSVPGGRKRKSRAKRVIQNMHVKEDLKNYDLD